MKPIYSLFIMLSFAGQLRAQNDTTELLNRLYIGKG